MSAIESLKDESLLSLYEGVRLQVTADVVSEQKHRFLGSAARSYADRLWDEIRRRSLRVTPIAWPDAPP